jgi:hypothetical protein
MVSKMMYNFFTGSGEYERVLGKSCKYHMITKREELMKTSETINCNVKEAWELRCGTGKAEDKFHRHFRTQAKFKHF